MLSRSIRQTFHIEPNLAKLFKKRSSEINKSFSQSSFGLVSKEKEVKTVLKNVHEPITQKALASVGIIQGINVRDDIVKVYIDEPIAGYPFLDEIESKCKTAIRSLGWVRDVDVNKTMRGTSGMGTLNANNTLSRVSHIIAVSSCKGGVGKSTVAVNLACELRRRNLKVGIVDADIYGPSLPLMLQALDRRVLSSPDNSKWILPLESENGLKMISFGHVNPKAGVPGAGGAKPAVMRGPVATKVITQLVASTQWGDLDYLVVDMPPGTGDIQITMSQIVSFSGAVIVTTPHELSLADAAKGVMMFEDLHIPTLALVENMAYFTCEHGKKYYPFGRGGRETLLHALTVPNPHFTSDDEEAQAGENTGDSKPSASLIQRLEECAMHSIPLSLETGALATGSDGTGPRQPIVVRAPQSEIAGIYRGLADSVISELFKLQLTAQELPMLSFVEEKGILLRYFSAHQAIEYVIPPVELRVRDPSTGALRKDHEENRPKFSKLKPVRFEQKGNYGVGIVWSDSHHGDIFPYEVLRKIANDCRPKNK